MPASPRKTRSSSIESPCGASSSPRGTTYEYDYQGYRSSDTTVVGGSRYGFPAYGAAFSFRDYKDVHEENAGKDPFVQSAPIDGVQFNTHLKGQGTKLKAQEGGR